MEGRAGRTTFLPANGDAQSFIIARLWISLNMQEILKE
jgi:hypothetical protein